MTTPMTTPADVAQRQLDAYNRRDLDAFLAAFGDSIRVYRPPSAEPSLVGKAQLADFYARERFNRPALRAELLARIVLGDKVFDHERISGVRDEPFEMMAVYEVRDGLIVTMLGFTADS